MEGNSSLLIPISVFNEPYLSLMSLIISRITISSSLEVNFLDMKGRIDCWSLKIQILQSNQYQIFSKFLLHQQLRWYRVSVLVHWMISLVSIEKDCFLTPTRQTWLLAPCLQLASLSYHTFFRWLWQKMTIGGWSDGMMMSCFLKLVLWEYCGLARFLKLSPSLLRMRRLFQVSYWKCRVIQFIWAEKRIESFTIFFANNICGQSCTIPMIPTGQLGERN